MRRTFFVVIMMLAASLACLSSDDNQQPRASVPTPTRSFPTAVPPGFFTATPGLGLPTATVSGVVVNPSCPVPAGWQAYVVQTGDTLGVIADTIGSTVAAIQGANCLTDSDTILVGQVLYLPSLPTTSVITTSAFNPTVASCAVPAGWVAYRVVAGDTLGTIAERVGSSVVALQNANCIANSEIIYVGQILYVPSLPAGVPTAVINPTITATQAVTCPVPSGWQAYIVQVGDTLGTIATRFNTTTAVLQAGNCLTNVDRIFAGQLLYVPAGSIAATATATPVRATTATPTTSSLSGNLPILAQNFVTVRPTVPRQDGALVTLQDTVALDIGVVQDADRVRYYAGDRQNDPNRVQIGVDNDPFDGTQITYVFNSFDPELYFFAAAENEFGSVSTQWVRVVYDPTFLVGTGKPDIFPFMGFDGSIYTLEPRRAVTISWTGAPTNATRIEFHLVQASTGDTVINIDTTPADGARVLWQVPALLRGQVFARAVFSNGSTSDSDPVNVYSEN